MQKRNKLTFPSITGNRIKSVRMLAGYTRKAFAERTGISAATLRAWEEPTSDRHGITEKGAVRLLKALQTCEVYCTMEWLLQGIGPSPSFININKDSNLDNVQNEVTWDEEESILKDIESFKVNNSNPIVAMVIDGSMLPFYSYGDYVGGSIRPNDKITSLIGFNCIVELENLTLIRKITLDQSKKFTLSALNIDSSVTNPVMQNVSIISAAKIVWHRTREKLKNIII